MDHASGQTWVKAWIGGETMVRVVSAHQLYEVHFARDGRALSVHVVYEARNGGAVREHRREVWDNRTGEQGSRVALDAISAARAAIALATPTEDA